VFIWRFTLDYFQIFVFFLVFLFLMTLQFLFPSPLFFLVYIFSVNFFGYPS
jgi:hypothetical protein